MGIFLVEHGEYPGGGSSQFLVGDVARVELRGSMDNDGGELPLLLGRKPVELVKQMCRWLCSCGRIRLVLSGASVRKGLTQTLAKPHFDLERTLFRAMIQT